MGKLDTDNINRLITQLNADYNFKSYEAVQWCCKHVSCDLKHEEEPTGGFK